MKVFTYGSLMDLEIFSAVTGETPASAPACLKGFARYAVVDEQYPGIVTDLHQSVTGRIYFDVSAVALEALDAFEGAYYSRQALPVECNGEQVEAETYVFRPEYGHLLSDRVWDWDQFLREGKARFKAHYVGFRHPES